MRAVIPAMQASPVSPVVAIASRDAEKARAAARSLGIPRSYGSYEELLADPEVDAVYNPLPNHLHVPWSIRAAEAGKHVLCEKPIALSAKEARELLEVRDRTGVLIGEAFMVRTHPQWHAVRSLIAGGRIGDLRLIVGHFSYGPRRPEDIRTRPEWGGGALLDIGCYPITMSRWLLGAAPPRGPPDPARGGRGRAARHRLLPDHHVALALRRRAARGDGRSGTRSRQRRRPAGVGRASVSRRAGELHLRGRPGAAPADADRGDHRADRRPAAVQSSRGLSLPPRGGRRQGPHRRRRGDRRGARRGSVPAPGRAVLPRGARGGAGPGAPGGRDRQHGGD